jgi:hypothetical protein
LRAASPAARASILGTSGTALGAEENNQKQREPEASKTGRWNSPDSFDVASGKRISPPVGTIEMPQRVWQTAAERAAAMPALRTEIRGRPTGRRLVLCLAVIVSACAYHQGQGSATTASPPMQSTGQSTGVSIAAMSGSSGRSSAPVTCDTIDRFSRASFMAADQNHDGVIDEAEFAADAAAAFAAADKDHSYRLTAADFPNAPPDRFQLLNTSHSGYVTFNQLMQTKMAEFHQADTNGDGALTLDEVIQFNRRQAGC